MQKITPFLWFDDQAEEAAEFYCSVLKNSKILSKMPGLAGKPMGVTVELEGQELILFNGGPADFKFNESFSLFVGCETQEEIDELWQKLTAEGEESKCGWLKDKYGLSWQIVPIELGAILGDPDPVKANRATQAMLGMKKLDIATLKKARDIG